MYCLDSWGRAHPQTLELLDQLYAEGQRCALISGAVAVAHGVRGYTEDTDLFTHPADFMRVGQLLPDPEITWNKQVEMRDRMGTRITFTSNELRSELDGTPIQVVQPLSDVCIGGFNYDVSHSDLVTEHLERVRVLGKNVLLTHIFDSIAMKLIFQRIKAHSSDMNDALGIARACQQNDRYINRRTEEMGFRRRERVALGHVGLGAPSGRSFSLAA
jgi:hypothetical protein